MQSMQVHNAVDAVPQKNSKMYKFGHILKIPCKKIAFDKLYTGRKF